MRLRRQSHGQILQLSDERVLAVGGEARIFEVPGEPEVLAKIYHQPSPERAAKLRVMLAHPPLDPMAAQNHRSFAWPADLLYADGPHDRIVGFLMPRITGLRRIIDFFNPKTRRQNCPCFNYFYLHRTAYNLAASVRALHEGGYVLGDVNESNILVSDRTLVSLVDTDSFQVWDAQNGVLYRCRVGKPEFTPPELQGKNFAQVDRQPAHDLYGLGVLLFELLMEGSHPFAGAYLRSGEPPTIEQRIRHGFFPHVRFPKVPFKPAPASVPFEVLHPPLQHLFVRCFFDGHRDPSLRPEIQSWLWALEEAEKHLVTCWVNDQHLYSDHLATCPWCERTQRLGGRDPFPSLEAVQRGEHLRPPPRAPRSDQPLAPVTTGRPLPMPRRITPLPVLPKAKSGRVHPPAGRSWSGAQWPHPPNYAAWSSLIMGAFGLLWARTLFHLLPDRSLFVGLLAMGLGGYGELHSREWGMDRRSRWLARAGMGLGVIYVLWFVIYRFFRG